MSASDCLWSDLWTQCQVPRPSSIEPLTNYLRQHPEIIQNALAAFKDSAGGDIVKETMETACGSGPQRHSNQQRQPFNLADIGLQRSRPHEVQDQCKVYSLSHDDYHPRHKSPSPDRSPTSKSPKFCHEVDAVYSNLSSTTFDAGYSQPYEDDPLMSDAYHEYVTTEPLPPRPETETQAFVSWDAEENYDNSSNRWSLVRNLRDDTARSNLAKDQFGNRESADPSSNLTYHGFRRQKIARSRGRSIEACGSMKKSVSVRIVNGKLEKIDADRWSSRTFETKRRKTISFKAFEAGMVTKTRELKLPILMKACSPKTSYDQSCKPGRCCPSCFRSWKLHLRHIKSGFVNSKNFLKFYLDDDIPEQLLTAGIELEKTYQQFSHYYGPNEVAWCKDCQATHVF